MSAREIALHEIRHLFAEAVLLSEHEHLYDRAEVYIDVKSTSGECAIAVPGLEDDPQLKAIAQAAAIGPATVAFDTAAQLVKMVREKETETLEEHLSLEDLGLLAQAEPTKAIFAAIGAKHLEKQCGPGNIHGLSQIIRKAVNQNLFPLPLAELVPIGEAKQAMRTARRDMELLNLGPRSKPGSYRSGVQVGHDVATNAVREYT